jgi:branched-chain amino acid transport system substrate-binding protein
VAALTFDAGQLLCAAIVWAGTPDRKKVRDALATIQKFEGVTGQMNFQNLCDPVKSAVILQIKDGKFAYHATVNP